MAEVQGDVADSAAAMPNLDELVAQYFGDVVPKTELQGRVMRTYAEAFEKTYLPEDEQPTSEVIRTFITDAHAVAELFSFEVQRNTSLARKVRPLLEQCDLQPVP